MKKIMLSLISLILITACNNDDEDVTVTAIQLDKTKLELSIGDTYEFKVEHMPKEAKVPTYEWNCFSNSLYGSNACKIDQSGKLTAVSAGTSIVRVKTTNVVDMTTGKPLMSECEVKVVPVEVENLTINKTEATLKGGETLELSVKVSPQNATENYMIYWESSDTKIVKVTKDPSDKKKAKVTVEGEGEATVTASVGTGKIKASCKIKVLPTKLESISLEETEKTVIAGEIFTLTPIFRPENATNKAVKWTTSNNNVAKVDDKGTVTTLSEGECEIKATAEDGGYEAVCKLIVKPVPVEGIEFKNYSYNVEIGGEKQLEVIFKPENAGNKNLKWKSSNSQVASVDENGIVKGNTKGNVTITAKTEDGGYEANCKIYVVEIDQFMDVYFTTSSVVIINGYYTGQIGCAIKNRSSKAVRLTRFEVIDTNTWQTVAETESESLLGELNPGSAVSLSANIKYVYEPTFKWTFEYNGKTYSTYNSYGDQQKSTRIAPVETKGKAKELFLITKE